MPEDIYSGPEDMSSGPEDMSSGPEGMSSGPEDMSSGPEDTSSGPEDMSEDMSRHRLETLRGSFEDRFEVVQASFGGRSGVVWG